MTELHEGSRNAMLAFRPPLARGAIAVTLLALNTLFWCSLVFLFALVERVIPAKPARAAVDRVLNGIATRWVAGNSAWMRLTQRTQCVTIVYPDGVSTFWRFPCGRVPRIVVRALRICIPPEYRNGDYVRDPKYRKTFQQWIQALWHEKDAQIDALIELSAAARRTGPT